MLLVRLVTAATRGIDSRVIRSVERCCGLGCIDASCRADRVLLGGLVRVVEHLALGDDPVHLIEVMLLLRLRVV